MEFVKANLLEVLLFYRAKPGDAVGTALSAALVKMTSWSTGRTRLEVPGHLGGGSVLDVRR